MDLRSRAIEGNCCDQEEVLRRSPRWADTRGKALPLSWAEVSPERPLQNKLAGKPGVSTTRSSCRLARTEPLLMREGFAVRKAGAVLRRDEEREQLN